MINHDDESGNNCDHQYAREKTSPQGRGHHKQTRYCLNCSLMEITNIQNNCFFYLDSGHDDSIMILGK